MSHHDNLYRYLFENYAVRGELATVWQTCQPILQGHDYPASVSHLLREMLAATSLLTATLKFEGDITVQIQGDGPLKLAVINGNHKQEMRGIARMQGPCPEEKCPLRELTGNGVLVITLTPKEGERYQGMVALEEETLAQCLETYFRQSEQLPTRLFFYTGDYQGLPAAGGMLLQVLPGGDTQAEDFEHLATLTETLTEQELLTLPAEEVLHRLYHQETVKLFPPQAISFKCTCSRERCAETLLALPQDSLRQILDEEGQIDMHCDYCGRDYHFSREDVQVLLQPSNSAQSKPH